MGRAGGGQACCLGCVPDLGPKSCGCLPRIGPTRLLSLRDLSGALRHWRSNWKLVRLRVPLGLPRFLTCSFPAERKRAQSRSPSLILSRHRYLPPKHPNGEVFRQVRSLPQVMPVPSAFLTKVFLMGGVFLMGRSGVLLMGRSGVLLMGRLRWERGWPTMVRGQGQDKGAGCLIVSCHLLFWKSSLSLRTSGLSLLCYSLCLFLSSS